MILFDQSPEVREPNEVPIVTFFSGPHLPKYARKSLSWLSKNWPGKVFLLTDIDEMKFFRPPNVLYFPTWFSSKEYLDFLKNSPLDGNFREGFWLKTAMRFFVIAQWMELSGNDRVLHLELDCALHDTEGMAEYFHSLGEGVYVPWVSSQTAIASIVYLAGLGPANELASFMAENSRLGNEMGLLARFLVDRPDIAFGLPSPMSLTSSGRAGVPAHNQLPATRESGVFDAAQVGHWLFGADPRNIRGRLVRANYEYDYGSESKRRFREIAHRLIMPSRSHLAIAVGTTLLPVRNLHVHSKVMGNAYRAWRLRFHFSRAKHDRKSLVMCWPKPIPVAKSRTKRGLDILLVRAKRVVLRLAR